MSETASIKARYVGHPDGVDLTIEYMDGDRVHLHVPHGGELPTEVEGRKVPATFRDSLLEQEDNWTVVRREAAKSGDKETK
jgi:hypothetical protein